MAALKLTLCVVMVRSPNARTILLLGGQSVELAAECDPPTDVHSTAPSEVVDVDRTRRVSHHVPHLLRCIVADREKIGEGFRPG